MPIAGLAKSAGCLLWVSGRLWLKRLGMEDSLGGNSQFVLTMCGFCFFN